MDIHSIMLKVRINTSEIEDRIIVKPPEKLTDEQLLELILTEYKKWHFPLIHSFEFTNRSANNDPTLEITVKESNQSILQKRRIIINDQLLSRHRNKIIKLFSNTYNLNWSFQSRNFTVNIHDPFLLEKNTADIAIAHTNFKFTAGTIFAEIEIVDMDDVHPLWIGLYDSTDQQGNYELKNSHRSISYASTGAIMIMGHQAIYSPFKKGDKISMAYNYRNKQLIFKKLGPTDRYTINIARYTSTAREFYIGASTEQKNCSIKLRYLDEKEMVENGTLLKSDAHYNDFIDGLNYVNNYLNKLQYIFTNEFIDKLVNYSMSNDIHVWDQRFALLRPYSGYIDFPDFMTVKLVGQPPNYCYNRSLAIIEKGIHFFEVEVSNVDKGNSSYVGVIQKDYDYANQRGTYWSYNVARGTIHGSDGGSNYGKPVPNNGSNVGIYLDLDSGTIEFFLNGQSQGIAFRNVTPNVQFYVTTYKENSEYKILPSNLETYLGYVYDGANNREIELISKGASKEIELISETKCKLLTDSFIIESIKRHTKGRQYFEATLTNISGSINFGMKGYTHVFHLGNINIDVKKVDIFDDNLPINTVIEPITTLGIMVDFDELVIEFYRNRVKVHERQTDENMRQILVGYISGKNVEKLDGKDVEIELSVNAAEEMKDVLILYE